MTDKRRNRIILAVFALLLVGAGFAIATKPTRLGLDLRGGVELIYQGRPTPKVPKVTPQAIDDAIKTIQERTNSLGVSEPQIQSQGRDEISIGLPAVQNAARAEQEVGTTAQLQFYDWEPNVFVQTGKGVTTLQARQRAGTGTVAKPAKGTACPATLKSLDGRGPPAGSIVIKVPRGIVIVQEHKPSGKTPKNLQLPYYVLEDDSELSGSDIKDPKQASDPQTSEPIVTFSFTDKGRAAFARATKREAQRGQNLLAPGLSNQSKYQRFAISLDNQIVSLATVSYVDNPEGIPGDTGAQINGIGSLQETQDLAENLRIGALPISLKLISKTQVSATLGKQALHQGLIAGAAGLLLTLIFLLILYRVLGVIAGGALIAYALLLFAMVKLIPITLTL